MLNGEKGQSLVELLIGVAIVTIIMSSIVGAVVLVVRSNLQSAAARSAAGLGEELMNDVRSVAEGKWSNLYGLDPKGPSTTYRVSPSGTPPVLTIVSGSEDMSVNSTTYTRFFSVENVDRDSAGSIALGGTEDPSTQKITITVKWQVNGQTAELKTAEYFTRSRNEVTRFTNWNGSSGAAGPVATPDNNYFSISGLNSTSTAGEIKLP